jgi:hypothetical protein
VGRPDRGQGSAAHLLRPHAVGQHAPVLPDADPALRNTASKLAPDIDTRGNGYVVAPPSVVNGNPYTVLDAAPVAPLPQWIVDALAPKPPAHRPATPPTCSGTTSAPTPPPPRSWAACGSWPTSWAQPPRARGTTPPSRIAFMVGGYVGAGQLDEDDAIGALLDAIAGWTYAEPGDARTMENTIIRQVEEGAKHPRAWEAARFQDGGPRTAPACDRVEEEQANPSSDWSTDDGQARAIFQWVGGMLYVEGVGWFLWDGRRWQQWATCGSATSCRRTTRAVSITWSAST